MCNIIKYKMELLFRLSSSSSHAWKYIHQYNIIPEQTVFQTIRNTLSVFTIVNSRTISISDKNIVKSLINLKKKKKKCFIYVYVYMTISCVVQNFHFSTYEEKWDKKSHIPWWISIHSIIILLLLLLFYFFQIYCTRSVFDIVIHDKNFVKIL